MYVQNPKWDGGQTRPWMSPLQRLTRCEIELFTLHGRASGSAGAAKMEADWDRLEESVLHLKPETHDAAGYFLGQVVATRLISTGKTRKGWALERYLRLWAFPSSSKPIIIRQSMFLVVMDLIHEFQRAKVDGSDRVEVSFEQHCVVTPGIAMIKPPISCHPDVPFRQLMHAVELKAVVSERDLTDIISPTFECHGLLAEYYADVPGSWFERDRLARAVKMLKTGPSLDLQTFCSRDTVSPWLKIAKVRGRPSVFRCLTFIHLLSLSISGADARLECRANAVGPR